MTGYKLLHSILKRQTLFAERFGISTANPKWCHNTSHYFRRFYHIP